MTQSGDRLRSISSFKDLVAYLEDTLGWPLEGYGFDEMTFEYEPEELGLKDDEAAKVRKIYQLRPPLGGMPWGIFFVDFENARLPVVVLRRILSRLVIKKRASANTAERAAWNTGDLLFISAFGGRDGTPAEIAFAHFHEQAGDLPTLRVLGWDGGDTPLKLDDLARTLHDKLAWPDDETDEPAWRKRWAGAFRHRIGHVIRTSNELAEQLAALARGIRKAANRLMKAETEKGPLRKLHRGFQTALIHDLTEDAFADTYAQTITYGLLTAAISRTDISAGKHGTVVFASTVAELVPVTNPFLKEMLETFLKAGGRGDAIDFDELGIHDVVELLRGEETDLPAVLRDFGNKNPNEDPVIHFYEHFLAAYDKPQKKQRGVFYTPQPVVSYIVRSVDELLKIEFGIEDGLASTVTWAEMAKRNPDLKIPEGVVAASMFVQILDPATGTATFLVDVVDLIHRYLLGRWKKTGLASMPRLPPSSFTRTPLDFGDYWNQYVPLALLPRVHGYELMMAPYAIAHMKIGLKLFETGYRFASEERARIYLTNALEPASDAKAQKTFTILSPALAREAHAVSEIKSTLHFTVVIGNPPYSVTSANVNPFIDALMGDYKKHVRGEQGLVALADDYIKFMRISQKLLELSRYGIWGMITNHGYLKGVIHRGVRRELIDQFHRLFILELHGDSNIGERVPAGEGNENVFDIQQGVAVSIGYRGMGDVERNVAVHSEVWGTRVQKYADLAQHTISARPWSKLSPSEPKYFLIPFDDTNSEEYHKGLPLDELMPINSCGIKTHRDGLVIDSDKATLNARMMDIATESDLGTLRERYDISDTRHWNLKDSKVKIAAVDVQGFIQPITYRPFDFRWIYYNPAIIEKGDSKFPTLQHMLKENIALLSARIQATGIFDAVFASKFLAEMKTAESSRSCTVFPLYIYANSANGQQHLSGKEKYPNFNQKLLAGWANKLGVGITEDFGMPNGTSPEDILHYIYSVLHSPCYRTRFAEFLKSDFPRIPVTGSMELFQELAARGAELIALHMLDNQALEQPTTQLVVNGIPVVEKISWSNDTVWIDKDQSAGFQGISRDVWNFKVGGYPVCEKWLKDRKGRTLSDDDIAHYQKIIVALSETIRIMGEIDVIIDQHGGWPGAFAPVGDQDPN